ncbi:MAG TPA: D-xylose ABC transporter ATP-binding protein [Lachnospiraceae bacterium]|nr:D-xylose ABC transporter ATP-binding protein [Lachnospiraceae bacterium]
MDKNNCILKLQHITKEFPGVKALDDVSVEFEKGVVHAIVGENGAGKSTLIKMCTGAYKPTSGEIILDGKTFTGLTPAESIQNGVGVIYQEFSLVNDLTVSENIFLGAAIRHGLFIDKKTMAERSSELFRLLQIDINPYEIVKNLSTGYQQMVEMAKALSKEAKILIMDEPTAPLTTKEVDTMFSVVRQLKQNGVTVIYISHRLEEIFEIADRVTVLRDGGLVTTLDVSRTNKQELIQYMVGRSLTETFPGRKPPQNEEAVLDVRHLSGNGLHDVSFQVYKGEILGLGGLIGAGRTELAELLFGIKKQQSGDIYYQGKAVKIHSPEEALKNGIGLVPEDRKRQGILTNRSIYENISASILKSTSLWGIIDRKRLWKTALKSQEDLRIKAPDMQASINNLSGGNQQKVILAKILAAAPELLILDEPTRGIDVGAKYEIYLLMNELVSQGKTIIMISSEMEELIGMSDRILVLSEGHITGELKNKEFSQEKILQSASVQQ